MVPQLVQKLFDKILSLEGDNQKKILELEAVLKVKADFSDRARGVYLKNHVNVLQSDFSLTRVQESTADILGRLTKKDIDHLSEMCFKDLDFGKAMAYAFDFYRETNWMPAPATCVPALIKNPEFIKRVQLVKSDEHIPKIFLENFSASCTSDPWVQLVAELYGQHAENWAQVIGPWLNKSLEEKVISVQETDDAGIARSFLNEIGVLDDVRLLALYKKYYISKSFEQPGDDIKGKIKDIFSQKSHHMEGWATVQKIIKKFHCEGLGNEEGYRELSYFFNYHPHYATTFAREIGLSAEKLQQAGQGSPAADAVVTLFLEGKNDAADELAATFSVPTQMIIEKSRELLFKNLNFNMGYPARMSVLKRLAAISAEDMADPKLRAAALAALRRTLELAGNIAAASEFARDFFLPSEQVAVIAVDIILGELRLQRLNVAAAIKRDFNLSDELFKEGAVHAAVLKFFQDALNRADFKNAAQVTSIFGSLSPVEIRKAAVASVLASLETLNGSNALAVQTAFNLPPEAFMDEQARAMVLSSLHHMLTDMQTKMSDSLKMRDAFNLDSEQVVQVAIKSAVEMLEEGIAVQALSIKKAFALSAEDFKNENAQVAAVKCLQNYLLVHSNYNIGVAKKIRDEFALSSEQVAEAATKAIVACLERGGLLAAAEKIKIDFSVSTEVLSVEQYMPSIVKGVTWTIENNKFEIIPAYAKLLSSEFFSRPEIFKAIVMAMRKKIASSPSVVQGLDRILAQLAVPHIVEAVEKDLWVKTFSRLRRIQEINQNENNDPWRKELQPLLANLMTNKIISLETDEDASILFDFIDTYGMLNLPTVFRLYSVCTKARSWDDIPEEVVQIFERYGIRVRRQSRNKEGSGEEKVWRFPSPRSLLGEMNKAVAAFQTELLADQIPSNVLSEIGREQFARLVGNTQWQQNGDTVDKLVALWRQTLAAAKDTEKLELTQLPAGYKEEKFSVAELVVRQKRPMQEQTETQKIETLLAGQEVQEQYTPLARALQIGARGDTIPGHWLNNQRKLLRSLQGSLEELSLLLNDPSYIEGLIAAESDNEKKKLLLKKQKSLANERGRVGISKQRDALIVALQKMENISFAFASEQESVEVLEILAELLTVIPEAIVVLREASALHMERVAPGGWGDIMRAFREESAPTPERIQQLASFSRQYVQEHYLHADQDPTHTGHLAFSSTLRLALERVWQQQEGEKGKMPIEQLAQKVSRIINPTVQDGSLERVDVSMVPAVGLLRIYSGDIGDACYTSKHEKLARNEYPNLHAWTYVTGRNTPQESLRGSLLGIQATRDDQVSALVARANNPQENFIQSVNADEFVLKSLQKVIATAKRMREARINNGNREQQKKIRQCVVVPLDRASASSTNREPVAEVYKRRFEKLPRIGLENSPETNFNGYQLWKKTGAHACVTIWEIDENGNETWYGDWKEKQ